MEIYLLTKATHDCCASDTILAVYTDKEKAEKETKRLNKLLKSTKDKILKGYIQEYRLQIFKTNPETMFTLDDY